MLGLPWPFPFFGGNFTEVKVAGNVPRDRIAPPSLPSPPPLPPFWPLELCVVITIRRIHTNRRTHQPANGYLHFGGGGMHDTQASARSGPLPSPSEVIARAPQAAALLDTLPAALTATACVVARRSRTTPSWPCGPTSTRPTTREQPSEPSMHSHRMLTANCVSIDKPTDRACGCPGRPLQCARSQPTAT